MALGLKDEGYNNWMKTLTLLTVPWSLLIGLLALLFHDFSLKGIITIMYLVFAGVNAFLIYLGFKRRKRIH